MEELRLIILSVIVEHGSCSVRDFVGFLVVEVEVSLTPTCLWELLRLIGLPLLRPDRKVVSSLTASWYAMIS